MSHADKFHSSNASIPDANWQSAFGNTKAEKMAPLLNEYFEAIGSEVRWFDREDHYESTDGRIIPKPTVTFSG